MREKTRENSIDRSRKRGRERGRDTDRVRETEPDIHYREAKTRETK